MICIQVALALLIIGCVECVAIVSDHKTTHVAVSNSPVTIICQNDTVIGKVNISLDTSGTTCVNRTCTVTVEEKYDVEESCDGKATCKITPPNCLQKNGFVNLIYIDQEDLKRPLETCASVDKPLRFSNCSTYDIDNDNLELTFEPEVEGCKAIYNEIQNTAAFIFNNSMKYDFCTINFTKFIHNRSECFYLQKMKIEYTCTAPQLTYERQGTKSDSPSRGLIIGVVVGTLVIIGAISVIFSVIVRRRKKNEQNIHEHLERQVSVIDKDTPASNVEQNIYTDINTDDQDDYIDMTASLHR